MKEFISKGLIFYERLGLPRLHGILYKISEKLRTLPPTVTILSDSDEEMKDIVQEEIVQRKRNALQICYR